MFGIFAALNFYFALNAMHVTKYRKCKFNEHETLFCYYCFYTDIIFSFPFDYSNVFNKEKE